MWSMVEVTPCWLEKIRINRASTGRAYKDRSSGRLSRRITIGCLFAEAQDEDTMNSHDKLTNSS
jgi:hypothetical protein